MDYINIMEYRLIQFSRNPLREEGKNIGVIAFDGSWAGFKAIGMLDGVERAELYGYSSIAGPDYRESLWVFGEWIEWFKSLCMESEGNRERINAELSELENQTLHFISTKGGYYETTGEHPETALAELFEELVGKPPSGPKEGFKELLEKILHRAEIIFYPEFDRDVEVTIDPENGASPIVFTLDYYLGGEKRVGFKKIRFQNARVAALDAKVNDAIYTFSEAQKTGFLDKERCVVLCDTPSAKRANYIDRLQSVATVIDISKHRAYWDISTICS
ncbi:hypothetical protein D8Y20_08520 [Mariprofundus sp. EBB-1]|uniref:hypothetical protein n=1 Tax=Mariprofundus sp. EBB-1 TaxID=2650971 RepID=UPI000EF209E5|nr:hypothetical protein [Mariprofundus sp. EBB-1]RLL51722.1 hypothetical protein D8Y20_08520 [Mariprofundus sp. EBB-1]